MRNRHASPVPLFRRPGGLSTGMDADHRLRRDRRAALALAAIAALLAPVATAVPVRAATDADADGVADDADLCPVLAGPTASGCPASETFASLKYSERKRFSGKVSSVPACVSNRAVTIYRRAEGADVAVLAVTTDFGGNFKSRLRARKGRHYAIVAESVAPGRAACATAVSPSFRVR